PGSLLPVRQFVQRLKPVNGELRTKNGKLSAQRALRRRGVDSAGGGLARETKNRRNPSPRAKRAFIPRSTGITSNDAKSPLPLKACFADWRAGLDEPPSITSTSLDGRTFQEIGGTCEAGDAAEPRADFKAASVSPPA